MNKSIKYTGFFALILTVILLVHLTILQGFSQEKYADNALNKRGYLELQQKPRGKIMAGDTVLATSTKGDDGFYQREYVQNPLAYGPVEGYLSTIYGSSGIEESYNDVLNGTDATLGQRWKQLTKSQSTAGNVELGIIPEAQETAYNALADAGYEGAVVAIRPSTGEVLAMASTPSYDPEAIADPETAESTWQGLLNDPGSPLLNHATQETLPPGSTFKVITTAAALNNGFSPNSQLTGQAQITLPGSTATLENYGGNTCNGQEQVSLLTAFEYSCNTAFVEMSTKVGIDPFVTTAKDFGVGDDYDLGLPMIPGTIGDITVDSELAQSAIGQRDVALSVLQNAVIAATVANDGVRMSPHMVSQITAEDGSVVSKVKPKELNKPISPEVAATLTELMRASERHTAGYAGQDIASKTGTAEHGEDSRNSNPHAWYIAFGPTNDADVAVAVVVKNGGDRGQAATGGSVAAPIGRAVIEAVHRAQG